MGSSQQWPVPNAGADGVRVGSKDSKTVQPRLLVNGDEHVGAASALRLVVMASGDPNDPGTNSGVASNLLSALRSHANVVGTVSSQPSEKTMAWIRVMSFAPTKSAWRSRWRLSMGQVQAACDAAKQGFSNLDSGEFDALMQIGTYCSVFDFVAKPVFAYIDHDLPALVQLDPRMRGTSMNATYVRRRLDHEKHVLASCARVFTFSEWCRDRVINDYGLDAAKIVAVGAGSNIDERMLVTDPDYEAQHAVILGFDFERKGGHQVLAAFTAVLRQLPRARLTVIGGLPKGEPQPGVTSTGRLTGPDAKEQIAAIFASASLYVMPSLFEPFGIAFLEAMAAGLPCIGSDICAMPEIIDEPSLIVERGDSESLARQMLNVLSNPELCRRYGHRARTRYRERYGWPAVATKIYNGMAEVTARSS